MAITQLKKPDLKTIINGAAFLGSGGGGSVKSGLQMWDALPDDAVIDVASVDDATKDVKKYTAMAAYIGSPDSMAAVHKPEGAINAVRVLNTITREPGATENLFHLPNNELDCIGYLVPAEIGALNTVVACSTAYSLKIPVIDADGGGRAVPQLEMLTFSHTDGLSPSPAILATPGDEDTAEAMGVHVHTPSRVEHYARTVISTADYNSMAGLAMWNMNGTTVSAALPVRGTLELTRAVGQTLEEGGAEQACALLLKADFARAETIFTGKIIAKETAIGGGFDDGRVILQSVNDKADKLIIYFKNENIIAWRTGMAKPVAFAPATIAYSLRKSSSAKGSLGFSNADIEQQGNDFLLINNQYRNPVVDISIISPHPLLVAAKQYAGIKDAFDNLVLNMGYPLAQWE